MRVILTCLTLAATGCGAAEETQDSGAPARSGGPRAEAISIRMGGREVRVRCEVECADLIDELSRLHASCMHDPMSTPHHVVDHGPLLSLGCCTETRAAYERACGLEGPAESCESGWGARCESGRLGEAAP